MNRPLLTNVLLQVCFTTAVVISGLRPKEFDAIMFVSVIVLILILIPLTLQISLLRNIRSCTSVAYKANDMEHLRNRVAEMVSTVGFSDYCKVSCEEVMLLSVSQRLVKTMGTLV